MAWPRFLPAFDQSSKIKVLPAPVGACTTTSLPARKAATASCCHKSGSVTWFNAGRSANCCANTDIDSNITEDAKCEICLYLFRHERRWHVPSRNSLELARLPKSRP